MRIAAVLALSLWMLIPCAGGAQSGSAQGNVAKRPMTFADLMAMKRVSDPQISVSGRWVLFSVTDVSLEKNAKVNHLWVVPLGAARTASVDGGGSNSGGERQVTAGMGESNGRFSPDGRWVMYSAATAEGKGEIFVAPWDDAAGKVGVGRAVTSLETEADGGIWAPDSKHFLFVSEVDPACESKEAMGAARSEAEAKCNAEKDAAAAKSPVKAQIWDDLLYRHWDHYVGVKRSHIFYASVEGGATGQTQAPEDLTPESVVGDHVAPTFSLGGPLGYAISPDGREIAYEVNLEKVPAESTNNDIFVLQVGAEPGTARKVSTSLGSDDGPAYSPDGRWLAWRSQKRDGYESDKFRLIAMNRLTGEIHDVLPKFDGWIDEFCWDKVNPVLFFTSSFNGEEPVFDVGVVAGQPRLLARGAEFSSITHGAWAGFNASVAVRMKVNHPAEIVVFGVGDVGRSLSSKGDLDYIHRLGVPDEDSGAEQQSVVSHENDRLLEQLELSKMEPFWFAGAGGTKVEGFVVKPPDFDASKKYPVKFLIHGGPQGDWGDSWSYRWNPELFAADGYVVVMVNPRGSTGYGQRFLEEVSGDWGGRPYVDLMKGMDAAEAKFPFVDKRRECALGASYGGYMADWVLTHTDRFKCIVTHDGMYDPVSAFGATEELWFNEWEFRPLETGSRKQETGSSKSNGNDEGDAVVEQGKPARPWDFYGKSASEDPFRRWSPMMFIRDAKTPTLVVHSQRDYRLDVSQGLQLFTALQLLGVPSKMLYFPDEGHWVLKPQNSQLWYETVDDWCDRWTGMGKYAAVGAEKNPAMQQAK